MPSRYSSQRLRLSHRLHPMGEVSDGGIPLRRTASRTYPRRLQDRRRKPDISDYGCRLGICREHRAGHQT
jgi:hypothetical protein